MIFIESSNKRQVYDRAHCRGDYSPVTCDLSWQSSRSAVSVVGGFVSSASAVASAANLAVLAQASAMSERIEMRGFSSSRAS
jgi:hypothetical protein